MEKYKSIKKYSKVTVNKIEKFLSNCDHTFRKNPFENQNEL